MVVALSLMTLVVAGGMTRLFVGLTYLGPVLLAGATAHVLSAMWRRLGLRSAVSVLLSIVGAALISVWLVLPGSTWYGVPVGRTLHAVQGAIVHGVTAFQTLSAPAPALPGFLLVTTWGVAAAAIAGDALLCRAHAPLEACVPAFTLFVFTAALGAPGGRAVTTALYLAAVATFVLVEEVHRRTSVAPWLSELSGQPGGSGRGRGRARQQPRKQGQRRLLWAGAALGAVAVVVATLVGPNLPGARSPGLVTWHHRRARSLSRIAESPLVSLKAELLSPSSVQVFSVAAARPSYWRLTALDHFNGTVWSATQAYQGATGQLTGTAGPGGSPVELTQTYRLTGLTSAWLPAAYRPVHLAGVRGAGYDRTSASLISPSTAPADATYTVASLVPNLTPAELSRARVSPLNPGLAPDLQLPANLPPSVAELARQVVKGQSTPYGKALALQQFFRDNFTYSLAPPPDSSVPALVDFLFDTRQGYCQQFAGAYAVLARAVGLPARVAVGFTPGQLGPDGVYHVLALDAHAWPEVWLGRYGWVPFEPTVGRGEPGAEAYTGVAPEQAEPPGETSSLAPATTMKVPSTTVPAGPISSGHRPSTASARSAANGLPSVGRGTSRGHGALAAGGSLVPALAGALAGSAVVVLLGALLLLPALRRTRRRARARGADRVVVAFTEVTEALARRGVARRTSETFGQYASRAAPRCPPEARHALAGLALAAQAAVYGPRLPSGEEVASAVSASRSVCQALHGWRTGFSPAGRPVSWRRPDDDAPVPPSPS